MTNPRIAKTSMNPIKHWLTPILLVVVVHVASGIAPGQQPVEIVRPIAAPATPLPPEAQSAGVTKFAFLAYGDTRSMQDGVGPQSTHSDLVTSMLSTIKRMQTSDYPVKFVLQSGDAVTNGRDAKQWNASFVDVVSRFTKDGNVPYYLIPGNHDVTTALTVNTAARIEGLKNYLDAMSNIIPQDGSPRRLTGYPAYAFGYGNTFVLGIDSDISPDERQYNWAKSQLEGLDRSRFTNVIVFLHHGPFTSGPHGASVEPATLGVRQIYMPLFRKHHVNAVLGGHEHLFEHYVEHYTDDTGKHRMDLVITAGGGAPLYAYAGEPVGTAEYLSANVVSNVMLDHIVKPSTVATENPYHFVIVRVDGKSLSLEVVTLGPAGSYKPYGKDVLDLRD